jgi:hypothetical protein
VNKRLFFSLEGVDLNDDDAIDAFAHLIWAKAMAEFTEQDTGSPPNNSHNGIEG